jgi:N-hydroxyarylamine O-acetyltransferase
MTGETEATDRGELPPFLVDRLLKSLSLAPSCPVSRESLADVYRAWCRGIPFDNVLRRIQISEGDWQSLRGSDPVEFAQGHVDHGIGGLCAPASGALAALLRALGFEAQTVLATIAENKGSDPDHATVVVKVEDEAFLLDTVILCERPLPLDMEGVFRIDDALHPIVLRRDGEGWLVNYASAMTRAPASCAVLDRPVNDRGRTALYRLTQGSPVFRRFNSALYARTNEPDAVVVVYRTSHVIVRKGRKIERQIDPDERRRLLVERFGMSPEIVARLPEDAP